MEGWTEKLDRKINSILLPEFSELDVFTLGYFVLLLGIHHYKLVLSFLAELLTGYFQQGKYDDLFEFILFGLLAAFVVYTLMRHAVSQKNWSVDEASLVGQVFYLFIGVLSIFSYIEGDFDFMSIDSAIAFILMIRSVLMVLLVQHFRKTHQDFKISERMTQTQATPVQLVALVVLGGGVYYLLQQRYELYALLLLGYFYVTLALQGLGWVEKVAKK